MEKIYKVLVMPDLHLPSEDERTINAIDKYIEDERFDEFIQIGDFMDFDLISHWNKENLRAIAGKSIFKDYEYGNQWLDYHQKLLRKNNKDIKFTIIEGNHDERVEKYIDANPQMEGMLEMHNALHFKKRNIKWVRFWSKGEIYKIGKARFIHGLYTNQYHAKKHVDNYGDNVFYGHTHDIQSHSREMRGNNKTLVGQSLGCVCSYDMSYLKGRPTKWQQALAEFHFREDGYFQYFIYRIFNHQFEAINGKIYKG